jgi:hypothetical protein
VAINSSSHICGHVLWFDCVSQSSCIANLVPNPTVLRGGTYKTWLDPEGSVFTNGLNLLLWELVIMDLGSDKLGPFFSLSCMLIALLSYAML